MVFPWFWETLREKILFYTSDSIYGTLKDYAVNLVFTIESTMTVSSHVAIVGAYKLRI